MNGQKCSVEVCDRPAEPHGMCVAHRWRARNGRPLNTPIGDPVRPDQCRQGHPLTGTNLYFEHRDGRKLRRCRACRQAAVRRHRTKTRATVERRPSTRVPVTHCPRGHEYTVGSTGNKYCRECRAAYQRERRATARAARPPAEPRAAKTATPKPPKSKFPKGWDKPADRDPKRDRERTVDKNTQWVDPGPPLGPELVAAAQALLARHDAQDLAAMLGLDKEVPA